MRISTALEKRSSIITAETITAECQISLRASKVASEGFQVKTRGKLMVCL